MRERAHADLVIQNARIRTLDPERPRASAIAVRDGAIAAVGEEAEVLRACDARTESIDAGGAALVPGLVDGHIHPFATEMVEGADLTRCATLADLERELARERARVGDGAWVRGWGLDYGVFAGQPLDGRALEDAVAGAPAVVTLMDQHTSIASPRALELAGVTGAVRFEEAAEVVVCEGRPTGELREGAAMDLVRRVMPALGKEQRQAMIVEHLRRLNAVGVTGVHVMDGSPATLELVRRLEARGELTLRVRVPLWQHPETPFEQMEHELPLRDARGRLWRGGVAKFFIDGVIDTGTGWLCEPDAEGDGLRPFWPDPERYARAVRLFAGAGFQCVTHATGDRGVRAALDAYRAAGAAPGVVHRVEHIETLQDSDLGRFAAEGVAASMQPLHMQWRQQDHSDSWTARLGRERAGRAWRCGDLLRSGAVLALGSDWPVAQLDPRLGMAWARLRRTPGRPDLAPFEPEQRLSGLEALAGYTTGNARVAGEAAVAGRLREGFRADLTGFAADPVELDADELPELPVTLTVVDGRVVYRA